MDTEENDAPAVISFFSKRAKFVPQISSEEFEATAKLLEEKKKEQIDVVLQPAKVKSKRKVPARGKNLEPLQGTVDDKDSEEDVVPSEEACLSASAKRRLKRLQLEHDRELKRIEAESQKVLSSISTSEVDEVPEDEAEDVDQINVLTISYLSDLSRLTCHENDKFSTIFPKVADMFSLKVSEFLLCLREHNIKVEDTPKSLKIAETDVLECIPYKADSMSQNDSDDDRIKLFFQSSDSKKKTEMFVHKLENMKDIMEKYSNTRDIPIDQLIFEFDGERIAGSETPEDMDMESGSCIDVRVSDAVKTIGNTGRKTRSATNVTVSVPAKTADSTESENCVDLIDSASDKTNESRESENCIDLTDSTTDRTTVSRESEDCIDLTASTSNNSVTPITVLDAESGNCTLVKVVKTTGRRGGRKAANSRQTQPRGRKAKTNSRQTQPTRVSPRKKKNSTSSVITVGSDSNDSILLCE